MHLQTLNLLNDICVLIVEDDEIARTTIKQDIKPYCKACYEAADGLSGLQSFKEHHIDVIITDIHMPGINGLDMIKEILKLKSEQLFIVMTSYDNDKNLIESMKEGACSFLRKPLDIEELQTALIMSLGRIKYTTKILSESVYIDYQKEIIYIDNQPVFLSHTSNKIFWLLSYNIGRLVSYNMIEDYIYDGESVNKNILHNAILRIKKQLHSIDIENIPSEGYILKVKTL
ncbi:MULTISPECIES: response regulator transcription factor [Sulfurospirillum]|uniref:Response regulator n=4 Tax=Sulfurospirillum TaxID=57665 RepID=A0A1Y0HKZ4_9BACT|nr:MULTISPECIES: response regulator [Sulfurospirillum]AHJ12783.1 putative two-component regulator [Sulfurospirillum multivorans DSM 12446]AOO65262.1 putative two-component regulator [Sulfurospirillum halorespirans DSM 13726]ARU48742.1 Transcriptional regulatory protein QseB [Sulfurospirillum diekertiae]ASC93564.1 Transcriptional regulatory protein QseB [Sulfurospirillum diekertiae]ATB69605.1 putative response regulator [Sulfurospirillum diekertiae]